MTRSERQQRVLLLMQFYEPEPVYKGQAFAEAVGDAGYDVEVVTGFPNYPGGKVYDGYRIRPMARESKNGVAITRLALYPNHGKSKIGRVLNYLSFAVSVFLYLVIFGRRSDIVYAYSPPPTVGMAAAAARAFRRFPVVVDIHDLWPDTLPATGMITSQRVLKVIDGACQWMYARVQHIILHSDGFRKRLIERGVPGHKLTTIIGWTHEAGADDCDVPVPELMESLDGLKVLYAGNVGPAQALGTIIEAAEILGASGEASDATFCILGSGIELESLKARAATLGLTNLRFFARVEQSQVGAYLSAADALIVHLRDDPLFRITMPSKTQAYMLSGRPILMAVPGEASDLIKEANAGLIVTPEDPESLVSAVRQLRDMGPEARRDFGNRGRDYYWRHLSMQAGMCKFADVFAKLPGRAT